jgi:hypothetical protein
LGLFSYADFLIKPSCCPNTYIRVCASLRKYKLPEVKPNFGENDKCVKLVFVASKIYGVVKPLSSPRGEAEGERCLSPERCAGSDDATLRTKGLLYL